MANIPVNREQIVDFCRKYGIRQLSFFGSVLRPDFRPDSGVDVLVEFEPNRIPTLFDLVVMEQELSAVFGGRKVDLRTPGDLSRYFRRQVLEEAEVQYEAGWSHSAAAYAGCCAAGTSICQR